MLIPALLMGNVAVLKLPAIGGLVHVLTAKAFAEVNAAPMQRITAVANLCFGLHIDVESLHPVPGLSGAATRRDQLCGRLGSLHHG